jgi:hypothetical protein
MNQLNLKKSLKILMNPKIHLNLKILMNLMNLRTRSI